MNKQQFTPYHHVASLIIIILNLISFKVLRKNISARGPKHAAYVPVGRILEILSPSESNKRITQKKDYKN